jgi:dTDP-4-dehydrorhamnose 3,5-epimerase-like enzyme
MSHEILSPGFERTDERGLFQEVLNDGQWEALLCGSMNANAVIGNHYHKKTVIFIYLTRGSARISTINVETSERDEFSLTANQGVLLHVNESHAINFLEDSEFVMLKSMHYDPNDPDTYPFPVKD